MNNLKSTTSIVSPNLGALSDFRNFLYLVWKHIGLPDPTPVQYDIAHWLQHGPKRKVVEAFRGIGKSWITAAYVLWRLRLDAQAEFLVVSASKERADQFSIFCKRLRDEMEILSDLRPKDGQRDSNISWDVGPHDASQSPSVKSVGITGQITGSRADEIIADDIEIPNNSATQSQRDGLSERVKEFDAILKPLPTSKVTYLGTPQTFESLYNRLPERGYEIRIWPAEIPTEEQRVSYGDKLAPFIAEMEGEPGTPTDPARFASEELLERRLSYGRSGYSLQFMLDTSLSDANRFPLKQSDLICMGLDPDLGPINLAWASGPQYVHKDLANLGFNGDYLHSPMSFGAPEGGPSTAPYTGRVMFIDPSGRGKDETGYAVVFMLHGHLFAMDVGGMLGGYTDPTLEALVAKAKRWQVNTICIEDNFGDGMFIELFKPVMKKVGYTCTIEPIRSTGQKERRVIDTLEPVMNRHKLVINKQVIVDDYNSYQLLQKETGDASIHYSLMHQLTHITLERGSLRHDDRLEALAGAVAYWVDQMAQDGDQRLEAHLENLRDKGYRDFIKSFHKMKGTRQTNANFLSRRGRR